MRGDSVTTNLRVLFDVSAKTTANLSLNDVQLVGPVVQSDLFSILLRFRKQKFIAVADIEKMYRQVPINPNQRSLQKILWKNHPHKNLKYYTLYTVTYGTTFWQLGA